MSSYIAILGHNEALYPGAWCVYNALKPEECTSDTLIGAIAFNKNPILENKCKFVPTEENLNNLNSEIKSLGDLKEKIKGIGKTLFKYKDSRERISRLKTFVEDETFKKLQNFRVNENNIEELNGILRDIDGKCFLDLKRLTPSDSVKEKIGKLGENGEGLTPQEKKSLIDELRDLNILDGGGDIKNDPSIIHLGKLNSLENLEQLKNMTMLNIGSKYKIGEAKFDIFTRPDEVGKVSDLIGSSEFPGGECTLYFTDGKGNYQKYAEIKLESSTIGYYVYENKTANEVDVKSSKADSTVDSSKTADRLGKTKAPYILVRKGDYWYVHEKSTDNKIGQFVSAQSGDPLAFSNYTTFESRLSAVALGGPIYLQFEKGKSYPEGIECEFTDSRATRKLVKFNEYGIPEGSKLPKIGSYMKIIKRRYKTATPQVKENEEPVFSKEDFQVNPAYKEVQKLSDDEKLSDVEKELPQEEKASEEEPVFSEEDFQVNLAYKEVQKPSDDEKLSDVEKELPQDEKASEREIKSFNRIMKGYEEFVEDYNRITSFGETFKINMENTISEIGYSVEEWEKGFNPGDKLKQVENGIGLKALLSRYLEAADVFAPYADAGYVSTCKSTREVLEGGLDTNEEMEGAKEHNIIEASISTMYTLLLDTLQKFNRVLLNRGYMSKIRSQKEKDLVTKVNTWIGKYNAFADNCQKMFNNSKRISPEDFKKMSQEALGEDCSDIWLNRKDDIVVREIEKIDIIESLSCLYNLENRYMEFLPKNHKAEYQSALKGIWEELNVVIDEIDYRIKFNRNYEEYLDKVDTLIERIYVLINKILRYMKNAMAILKAKANEDTQENNEGSVPKKKKSGVSSKIKRTLGEVFSKKKKSKREEEPKLDAYLEIKEDNQEEINKKIKGFFEEVAKNYFGPKGKFDQVQLYNTVNTNMKLDRLYKEALLKSLSSSNLLRCSGGGDTDDEKEKRAALGVLFVSMAYLKPKEVVDACDGLKVGGIKYTSGNKDDFIEKASTVRKVIKNAAKGNVSGEALIKQIKNKANDEFRYFIKRGGTTLIMSNFDKKIGVIAKVKAKFARMKK